MARQVSEHLKKRIWDEVRAEFPDDAVMQEVHYVRLLHHYQTEGLSPAARVRFYSAGRQRTNASSRR